MNIPSSFLTQLSERLGIPYLPDAPFDGNVCLADSEEVRPAFRSYFTLSDVMSYAKRKLRNNDNAEPQHIDFGMVPLPVDADEFFT